MCCIRGENTVFTVLEFNFVFIFSSSSVFILESSFLFLYKGKTLSNPSVCALCLRESTLVLWAHSRVIVNLFSEMRGVKALVQVFAAGIVYAVVTVWCRFPLNLTELFVEASKCANNGESIGINNRQAVFIKRHYMWLYRLKSVSVPLVT